MKNEIVCKHCGNVFFKKAKSCPNCGTKHKKPIWKRVWFWVLIIILGLIGGCMNEDTEKTAPTEEKVVIEEQVVEEDKDVDTAVSIVEDLMESSFSEYEYKVYAVPEDETIYIDIHCPGIADEVTGCVMSNNFNPWEILVNSSKELTKNCDNLISTTTECDYHTIYSIYDKVDGQDTLFLSCVYGGVLFDMVKDGLGLSY